MMKYGMDSTAWKAFQEKHKQFKFESFGIDRKYTDIWYGSSLIHVYPMNGDCTAAYINTGGCDNESLDAIFPVLQEYLSLNARINCFATRIVGGEQQARYFIKLLKKHKCKKISINIANRDNMADRFLISYNIKVPNPHITNYTIASAETVAKVQDYMDFTEYNQLQQRFGLYVKDGNSL